MDCRKTKTLECLEHEILIGSNVGSQMWKILSRLGVHHRPDCHCLVLASIMNDLGPAKCREQHKNLLRLLNKNRKKYSWGTHLIVLINLVRFGLVFKIGFIKPLHNLLRLSIEMAEEHGHV